MQPPTESSPRCGNFHQVQQVASQGVRWLFGCLPCVKGHYRIHPCSFETLDGQYVLTEGKKRLKVLHMVPDSNDPSYLSKNSLLDHVDSGEFCSLDSAGGDYWFMRWNRPIRTNFQRNSCNCSFRRSQIKSNTDLKEANPIGYNNKIIVPIVTEEDGSLLQSCKSNVKKANLCNLAESISQCILKEAVAKSLEILTHSRNSSQTPSRISENLGHNSSRCCDSIAVDDVKLAVKASAVEFGGYVNPVFLGSIDDLNQIPSDDIPDYSCDNQSPIEKEVLKSVETVQESFVKEHQDYNANDHNHQNVEDRNSGLKHLYSNSEKNSLPLKCLTSDKKKHRKSCLVGSKAYLKKPLLLLIHGAGSNSEVWRGVIHHLVQAGYECVAPDLLGHGLSSAPDVASHYTFHALLQDMLCIFDRFIGEGRSAVILGHGYGCSLAAAIARYRPDQVVQLVLISGGGPTPLAPRTPPSVSPCLRACLEPLLMCGFKRDVVYSVCGKQMEPCSPETSAVPRHIVEHIAQGHIWPEGDAAFHRRITAPTLLVHGMKDQHITLVQQCEMERTIPRSFLEVIPDAGHWAMLETPNHLSHMILCFIDWWAPPNPTL